MRKGRQLYVVENQERRRRAGVSALAVTLSRGPRAVDRDDRRPLRGAHDDRSLGLARYAVVSAHEVQPPVPGDTYEVVKVPK